MLRGFIKSGLFKSVTNSKFILPKISSIPKRQFALEIPYSKQMIEDRVLLVLRLYDKINPETINLNTTFSETGIDSLDYVEVIMNMEYEFGFDIPDDAAYRFKKVGDISQYVCDKFDVY